MMLEPGQLSALTEMGIPVWELRSQEISAPTEVNNTIVDEALAPLPAVDCLIVISEQDNHVAARRLLDAMLFSIGLAQHNSAILSPAQLTQFDISQTEHKLVLAFGDNLVPQSLVSSEQNIPSVIDIITSLSLSSVLADPAQKALVWRDLQSAKKRYQQDKSA